MNLPAKVHCRDIPNPSLKREALREDYSKVRQLTQALCRPLALEDYVLQSMPDVSPPKWHLAHTSWFFETFILIPACRRYSVFNAEFAYLFNSYYKGLGPHHPRNQRGLISHPTTEEVYAYRRHVDEKMQNIFEELTDDSWRQYAHLIQLGLHHEQQHQELILTDTKHIFSCNPIKPIYQNQQRISTGPLPALQWHKYAEGLYEIGYGGEKFSFDNERPRHRVFLENFRLASRLVSNGEYLKFIQDEAYHNPLLWLSDGWDLVLQNGWNAPLYWEKRENSWWHFTLSGMSPIDNNEPVCHISYYEADAYARWASKRLPTEAEWEISAEQSAIEGNFLDSNILHPLPPSMTHDSEIPQQIFGDVWEWTQSPYTPYPGFRAEIGTIGEYNGKFMCNQMVLRGGSCLTPMSHIRSTYRNFFPPHARWQCTGIRLAEGPSC
jgi:ergothioneine biosynthesis protein EgtB